MDVSPTINNILQRLDQDEQEWTQVDNVVEGNEFLPVLQNHKQWCMEVLRGERGVEDSHIQACEQFLFDSLFHRFWHRLRVENEKWAALIPQLYAEFAPPAEVQDCLATIDNHITYCKQVLDNRPTQSDRIEALEQFLQQSRALRYQAAGQTAY